MYNLLIIVSIKNKFSKFFPSKSEIYSSKMPPLKNNAGESIFISFFCFSTNSSYFSKISFILSLFFADIISPIFIFGSFPLFFSMR